MSAGPAGSDRRRPRADSSKPFAQAYVDLETKAVPWPNGADLDPDVLYDTTLVPEG